MHLLFFCFIAKILNFSGIWSQQQNFKQMKATPFYIKSPYLKPPILYYYYYYYHKQRDFCALGLMTPHCISLQIHWLNLYSILSSLFLFFSHPVTYLSLPSWQFIELITLKFIQLITEKYYRVHCQCSEFIILYVQGPKIRVSGPSFVGMYCLGLYGW